MALRRSGCQFNDKRDAVRWCCSLSQAVSQAVPGLQFCKTSGNGKSQCVGWWVEDPGSCRSWERLVTQCERQAVLVPSIAGASG